MEKKSKDSGKELEGTEKASQNSIKNNWHSI